MQPLTLFTNADLYDPEPRGISSVLVGGGAVLRVGSRNLDLPQDLCAVIDLQGQRLIPGLIDAHVHVTGGGGEAGPRSRVGRVTAEALAAGGVTSVVGVLGTDGTTRTVADLVATTLGLRAEGLSAWCWTGSYQVPPITLTGSVRSDVVFVDPVVGAGEIAISDHRSSQPTEDELARIASECHVAGLLSGKAGILHMHLGDGPRGLDLVRRVLDRTELPARVFHPTHVNRRKALFEEAILLARRGSTVDVTAFPVDEGDDAWSAPEAIERYLASGAPPDRITCSSDGGGCLPTFDGEGQLVRMEVGDPGAVGAALAALVEHGLPLGAVLPIFTRNVGSLLRLPRKGAIRERLDADLVVLDAAHRPRHVMARGRFVVLEGRPVPRTGDHGPR